MGTLERDLKSVGKEELELGKWGVPNIRKIDSHLVRFKAVPGVNGVLQI